MDYLNGLEDLIAKTDDRSVTHTPMVSVVVVTYCRADELIECLDSLQHQTCRDFEVVIVDNGGNESVAKQIAQRPVKHVRLRRNVGLSTGRNVGIRLAKGEVVVFLDDDLIAAPDLVEAHARAHADLDIVALRGRCAPKTRTIWNFLQFHYDLGSEVRPALLNLAGNSSFNRGVLVMAGGFNPQLFGHEETELAYRLITIHGIHRRRIVYYPHAVGYHDYSRGIAHSAQKRRRHAEMWEHLALMYPDIEEFVASYSRGGGLRPWGSLPRRACRASIRSVLNVAVGLAARSTRISPRLA